MNQRDLWVDCDPGIDDAFALVMVKAFEDQFNLVGLSSVVGNVPLLHTGNNLKVLTQALDLSAPIFHGARKPLVIASRDASAFHGAQGLGYFNVPPEPITGVKAWDALYEAARESGSLTLVFLGPLTNLAMALLKYPDLPDYLAEVHVMGGSATFGNHSMYGEFNLWHDPHSAQIVFSRELNLHLYGLNFTTQVSLPQKMFEKRPMAPSFQPIYEAMTSFLFNPDNFCFKPSGVVLHDAMVVASLVEPCLAHFKPAKLWCETKSPHSLGQSKMNFDQLPEKPAMIAMRPERGLFEEIFANALEKVKDI